MKGDNKGCREDPVDVNPSRFSQILQLETSDLAQMHRYIYSLEHLLFRCTFILFGEMILIKLLFFLFCEKEDMKLHIRAYFIILLF